MQRLSAIGDHVSHHPPAGSACAAGGSSSSPQLPGMRMWIDIMRDMVRAAAAQIVMQRWCLATRRVVVIGIPVVWEKTLLVTHGPHRDDPPPPPWTPNTENEWWRR